MRGRVVELAVCDDGDVDRHKGQALIVGASSTIGSTIAVELAGLGYATTLWGQNRARLEETAAGCVAAGQPAVVDLVDVTAHERLAEHVGDVVARGPLEVVVWTAGLFDWALADEADPQVWSRLFDVNLVAAAVLTPLVLPPLIAAAPSALVYLGSGAPRGCPTEIQLQPQRRV